MSPTADELAAAEAWELPPREELDENEYLSAPPGADPKEVRQIVRLVWHVATGGLVRFSIILQAFRGGRWHEVAEIDCCHNVDVHLHQNARSTGERVGDPRQLGLIGTIDDVQAAYNVGSSTMDERWAEYLRRWHHG